MDKQLKQQILPYLQQIQQQFQIPILYVSHSRYEVARLADQVLMLQAGKVVKQGSVSELFNTINNTALGQQQAVLHSQVVSIDQTYHLAQLNCSDFDLSVSAGDLIIGQHVRVLIQATDISISLEPLSNSSILNIPVSVQAIQPHPEKPGLLLLQLHNGHSD